MSNSTRVPVQPSVGQHKIRDDLELPPALSERILLLRRTEQRNATAGCVSSLTIIVVPVLLHFVFHVPWLWSGLAGIVISLLLVCMLVTTAPPADELTLWAGRIMRLQSELSEIHSKAVNEIVTATEAPDPLLREIFPELFKHAKSTSLYRGLAALLKKDQAIATQCLTHPDPTIRKRAIGVFDYISESSIQNEEIREALNAARRQEIGAVAQQAPGQIPVVQEQVQPRSERVAYSLVLIVAEEMYFPVAEQLEQRLLSRIRKEPRYLLKEDVQIDVYHVPQLPEETRPALQALVWTMQQRYGKRGGKWQTEFQPTKLGVTFLVLYME